jgi:hypothetical protein
MPRHLAVLVALALASSTRADAILGGPRPPPHLAYDPRPQPRPIRLQIQPTIDNDRQTRLRMPGPLLKALGVELRPGNHRAALTTVAVGLALALALVSGGLWLTRSKGRRLYGGAGLLLAGLVVLGVSGCPPLEPPDAHDRPPPGFVYSSLDPLKARDDGGLGGDALLEADPTDDTVRVSVPYDVLKAFVEKAAPAPQQP